MISYTARMSEYNAVDIDSANTNSRISCKMIEVKSTQWNPRRLKKKKIRHSQKTKAERKINTSLRILWEEMF